MKKLSLLVIFLFVLFTEANYSQTPTSSKSEEEITFEVLKPTINKWMRGKNINTEFQGESNSMFQPYLVDVNGDGRKELAIRNQCAPVGNCQFRLFKKTGKRYKTIMKTLPGAVQTFELKTTKTNGYFDIETKDHADAWSGEIEIYKFNGREYKVRECATYNYSYLKDGKQYELKKPKITSIKCSN